jgi:hypothetical protein
MKWANYTGIAAAILLTCLCFAPWAYYPDLHEFFTGFYSRNNQYGKPGKSIFIFSVAAIILFLIPRLWAKRINQFVCVLIFAYAIKNYFVYSACYGGICPTVEPGLIAHVVIAGLLLVCSLLYVSGKLEKV